MSRSISADLVMRQIGWFASLYPDAEILLIGLSEPEAQIHAVNESVSPAELGGEASLTMIATRDERMFRRYEPQPLPRLSGTVVNPLYRIERRGDVLDLTLEYPTPEYAEEFGESRRYLAPHLTISAAILAAANSPEHELLRRRRILLDVPDRYL